MPLEKALNLTPRWPNLSKDLCVGFRRPYGANLSRENLRSGCESLRSDALAMRGRGSAPRFTKPCARFWLQGCCLPVPSR